MSKLDTVIATLNNLDVGSLDKIAEQLSSARRELERLDVRGLGELVDKLDACRSALARGELDEFRRLRETVDSRLGHVRVRTE